jgi:2-iminoacetate synthase
MKDYAAMKEGFSPLLAEYAETGGSAFTASAGDIGRILQKERITAEDFAMLLSPAAGDALEALARRAERETLRHFGRAKQLFAPLYLANVCTNSCVYCGFHAGLGIRRRVLAMEEIEEESRALAATGLRKVLALTGDAPRVTGADYIAAAAEILSRRFSSVGVEVPALTLEEYAAVARAGADGMTMFQETYDRALYARLHPAGPKRDFAFRLDAPHRAALAGMRGVTLGALLGLGDWRFDALMLGLHGAFLQRVFPHLELSFSLPRLRPRPEEGISPSRPEAAVFTPVPVGDREFVQIMTALRCFLPHAGITLSTRERAFLRDRLLPLGVTRLSAGVSTAVGGYAGAREEKDAVQFVIDDQRGVPEMAASLENLGYQPVFADWLLPDDGVLPLSGALRRALGLRREQPRVAPEPSFAPARRI